MCVFFLMLPHMLCVVSPFYGKAKRKATILGIPEKTGPIGSPGTEPSNTSIPVDHWDADWNHSLSLVTPAAAMLALLREHSTHPVESERMKQLAA